MLSALAQKNPLSMPFIFKMLPALGRYEFGAKADMMSHAIWGELRRGNNILKFLPIP
jgi:hypothetical protein